MYYPFVPAPGAQKRNTERELQLKAQVGNDLPLEPEHGALVPALGHPAVGVGNIRLVGLYMTGQL